MQSKRQLGPGFWIFLFACVLQLSILLSFAETKTFLYPDGDMRFYADWGNTIAEKKLTDGKAFYGLPGYAFVLGGIFSLIGYDLFTIAILQSLAMAGVAWLIFHLSCWIVEGEKGILVGCLAALGWSLFTPAQVFSVILMPTIWLVLAFWGTLWIVARTESRSLWRPWLWIGVATGLIATMVATIFFMLPLVMVAAARNLRRYGAIATAWVVLFTGVFIGTAPCWVHNYFVAGEPVLLSAHGGINFWIGNNPGAHGYPRIPEGLRSSQAGLLLDSQQIPQKETGRKMSRSEISAYWSAKAKAWIAEDPQAWLSLMKKKFHNLWHASEYDDLSIIREFEVYKIIGPGLSYGVIAMLAIPGMIFGVWRYRRAGWILAAVCLHFAALMPVFITERYRMAAVPGLLILAALGLVDLIERAIIRAPEWWKPALAYLLITGFAAIAVFREHHTSLDSLHEYNVAVRELRYGYIDSAQKRLESIYRLVSSNADINAAMGNLWMKKGDEEKAKWFYNLALALESKNVVALNRLAHIWMKDEKWAEASRALQTIYSVEPENSEALYLLAYNFCKQDQKIPATNVVNYIKTFAPDMPLIPKMEAYLKGEGDLPPLPENL